MIDFPPEAMLASKMTKPIEYYIEKNFVMQEKSDGIRALIIKEGDRLEVFGRNKVKSGARQKFTPQLPEVVDYFMQYDGDFAIDCELMSSDFLTLQTKVRTTKTVITDDNFYVRAFDILKLDRHDFVNMFAYHENRYLELLDFREMFVSDKNPEFFKVVPEFEDSVENYQEILDYVVNNGGEGLIIKHPRGRYSPGKRSPDWVKVLPYYEMDVMMFDVTPGVRGSKYENTLGSISAVSLEDWHRTGRLEKTFEIGSGWTDELRNKIWEKAHSDPSFFPIPGKIQYKNLYPSGIPRIFSFLSFNVDKELFND